MSALFQWVKNHKVVTILLFWLAYTVVGSFNFSSFRSSNKTPTLMEGNSSSFAPDLSQSRIMDLAPAPQAKDRLVVQESNQSLLVKNVVETLTTIKTYAQNLGGYMVQSNLDNPQEAASGSITLRLPEEKLDESLAYFRTLSLKVVSENLFGTDVTDEFVDIEARLAVLQKNKARFEEIMAQAINVDEILRVQTEIFNIQSQIDSLHGQQKLLSQTAKFARMTVYLSTDELALPYSPQDPWRPAVIFKLAVRSLITNLRLIGTLAIWAVVYSVIGIPLVIVFFFFRKRQKTV